MRQSVVKTQKSAKAQVKNMDMVQKAPSVIRKEDARAFVKRSSGTLRKEKTKLEDALMDALNNGWWDSQEAEAMRYYLSMLSTLLDELDKELAQLRK